MKKIILLTAFLASFAGFSQAGRQVIQAYLDSNRDKYGLSKQDVSDWFLESQGNSTTTKITTNRIVQRYQGIQILDAQSNVWVKDGQVINMGNNFQSQVASRINTTTPSLSTLEAVAAAYNKSGNTKAVSFSIVENQANGRMLLSDGVQEDAIVARFGFQKSNGQLRLAYSFQFYSLDGKHYWDMRIDAVNGAVLSQKDLTVSCAFDTPEHHAAEAKKQFSFENLVFNAGRSSMLDPVAGSYRVIPYNYISPNHHSFDLITTAGNALASPNGWHDANTIGGTTATLKYTYSRGNNMLVQEDADGNNGTGIRAEGGAALLFDFPYAGPSAQPTAYTNAAMTNLFYMGNVVHDIWYQYGFDETNGNYQQNNLGRGGVTTATGDAIYGDAQDGYSQTTPTLNNANFTPTNDGVRPRVQMFLWNAGSPPTNFITVNSPAPIAGPYAATTNVFEGTDRIPVPVAPNGIVSDLALYVNDPNPNTNTVSIHNACVVPTNAFDISGKIALIRRGNCNFSNKVKNAQDAGALAVIVYDTVPNNPVRLSMSSTGILGITIPAVFVTKEIGDTFVAQIEAGTPVNVKLEVPADLYLYADGDFDNTIIGHELGHGISNRLVGGGLAGCMTNYEQMGEGWSDWFGLVLQIKPGDTGADPKPIGTFVVNEANTDGGIRSLPYDDGYPYSTDIAANPLTLVDSNLAIPVDPLDTTYRYTIGKVWCSILWDLTWAYIEKYGFDPDIYNGTGGNNKVMRLVADALKLETCNGTNFVTSRDNLLAAEQATSGGADYCLITDVFTRRGVGLNASSGSADDSNDQVEDFTAFPPGPNCTLAVNHFAATDNAFRVYPNPSQGVFNIRINKFAGKVNLQVVDMNGRVVFTQNNADFNVEKSINLSGLSKGMYVLKVGGSSVNYAQKIVIE